MLKKSGSVFLLAIQPARINHHSLSYVYFPGKNYGQTP